MARVPVAGGNLVERRTDPSTAFQAVDMGEGGRAVGQAVQRFGAELTATGEAQDRLDAQLDEAGAKQLDVEYSNWSRARLYTDDGAFYTKEGFDAANARPELEKSIEEQRQALLGKATTPRMRQMLSDALERRAAADLEGIARHASGQLRVEQKRQSVSRMAAAGDDAVTYSDDDARFAQELEVGKGEIRTEASRSGAAPETMVRAEREFVSDVYARVAKGKIDRGDVEGASAWIEAHRDKLLPEQEAAIDSALRNPLMERQADGIVDDLLGTAPADTGGQAATGAASSARYAGGNMLSRMVSITAHSESGNRERDAGGRLITSPKGAAGKMQVMPGTNLDPGFGVRPAADGSDAERTRVGRDYLAAMMKRYGGDPAKAWAAYNWGPGNLDQAVARHGAAWLSHAPAETRAYVRGNMAALGGRGGGEVQQSPREHDMAALLARVDQMNLPFDLEQKVRRQLTERVGLDEQLLSRSRAQAEEQATAILDRAEAGGRPITRDSQIPQSVWNAMSPSARMQLRGVIERNASPAARETNYTVYAGLSDLYARDPAAFAKLNPMEFRNSLSNSDFEQMMGWRRDALKGASEGGRGEGQVTHSRIRSVVDNAAKAAGLSYQGLRTKDTAGRQIVDRRLYQLENAISQDVQLWQRANPGKAITDLEIAHIADRQLIRWKPHGAEWDDEHPTYWFERNVRTGQIIMPRADRDRLRAQGRRILGREPTGEEITAAYLREARGGN